MKRVHALTLELPQALPAWPLLVAEIGAATLLFLSGGVPAVLVRALQLFLRF